MTKESAGHFADRFLDAVARFDGAPVCVGIDPVVERLPDAIRPQPDRGPPAALDAIYEFSAGIIDSVADIVPAVKFQSACFERYRSEGVEALYSLIDEAHRRNLLVILDGKRGDVSVSAEHYAASFFSPSVEADDEMEGDPFRKRSPSDTTHQHGRPDHPSNPDAVTVNAYLGMDGVEPFCRFNRGVFALVRTSNPGSDDLQSMRIEGEGLTVAEHVATCIAEAADQYLGESGYSTLGAVVGATKSKDIARLRRLMPRSILLVPGFGAQGGSAEDVRAAFNEVDGQGAIITASRSVIYAFDPPDAGWAGAIAEAAESLVREIRGILS